MVVETMMHEILSYHEAAKQFEVHSDTRVASWGRLNLMEGREQAFQKISYDTIILLHFDQG